MHTVHRLARCYGNGDAIQAWVELLMLQGLVYRLEIAQKPSHLTDPRETAANHRGVMTEGVVCHFTPCLRPRATRGRHIPSPKAMASSPDPIMLFSARLPGNTLYRSNRRQSDTSMFEGSSPSLLSPVLLLLIVWIARGGPCPGFCENAS